MKPGSIAIVGAAEKLTVSLWQASRPEVALTLPKVRKASSSSRLEIVP